MSFAIGDRVRWLSTPGRFLYGTYAVDETRPGVKPDGDPDMLYLDAEQLLPAIPAEDGVYPHLPSADYHGDKGSSLSASGAKLLLPPSCPAKFRYAVDRPPDPKPHFDFGHAAHKFVLGEGEEIVPVYADDWRTKAAQEQRKKAHAEGKVPLLAADVETAMAMANAVLDNPVAGPLFQCAARKLPERAEVSWYATDPGTGIRLRARPDWQTEGGDGRMLICDYKTNVTANPDAFARKAADYRYHLQAAWYVAVAKTLGLHPSPAFLFIVQEKTPPYLVSVVEFEPDAMAEAARLMRQAIGLYAQCARADDWPGYEGHDQITPISLPPWAIGQPTIGELLEREEV